MGMNTISLAVAETQQAIKGKKNLQDRLRCAMENMSNHWMITDKYEQFRCAVAAVILESPTEDADRIKNEYEDLERVSAAFNAAGKGISIDFSMIKIDFDNHVGLMKMWNEVNKKKD